MEQEQLKRLKGLSGKVRGVAFATDAKYVVKKIGESGLQKLIEKTKELGWEIDYQDIRVMDWYPIGQRALSLIAVQEAFNFGSKEIKEMGNIAPKHSLIAGVMMKYFISLAKIAKEAPKYWQQHYTVGVLESYKLDEKNRKMILRLKDFKIHPVMCPYVEGYFLMIAQFVVKSEKINVEETKCELKGDPYHEFTVTWE